MCWTDRPTDQHKRDGLLLLVRERVCVCERVIAVAIAIAPQKFFLAASWVNDVNN